MVRYCFLFFILCIVTHGSDAGVPAFNIFTENGKQGLKNDLNQVIIPAKYDELGWSDQPFSLLQDVAGYRIGDKWGLISVENVVRTEAIYSSLSIRDSAPYIEAGITLGSSPERLGLINRKGHIVLEHKYSDLYVYTDRIVAGRRNGTNLLSYGLMDHRGKILIPFKYRDIRPLGSLRYIALNTDSKFELLDDSGGSVADFMADSIGQFNSGRAAFWNGHLMGIINTEGKVLVPAKYKDIEIGNSQVRTTEYPVWYGIDTDMDTLFRMQYDEIFRVGDSSFHVRTGSKHWITDQTGNRRLSMAADWMGSFRQGTAVFIREGRYGLINSKGREILPPRMHSLEYRSGFYYGRDGNGNAHVFDLHGIRKNKVDYDSIGPYQRVYFPVKKGEFWGLMSRSGEERVFCVYDSLGRIRQDRLVVKFKGHYGIIDLQGHWILTPVSSPVMLINEELYMRRDGKLRKIYSYDGELIYFTENPIEFHETYFVERLSNGKVWRISLNGVIQTDKLSNIVYRDQFDYSEFEEIYPPTEGFSAIRKDGKYGFIDDQNRLRVANRYDSVQPYSENYAAIKLLGKWGFINKREVLKIQPRFEEAGPFIGGISLVRMDGKYNLIDKNATYIFKGGFDAIDRSGHNRYKVRLGDRYGLVDSRGRMLVNFIYEDLRDLGNGFVIVEKLGKKGVVNIDGSNVLPRSFSEVKFDDRHGIFMVKLEQLSEALPGQ